VYCTASWAISVENVGEVDTHYRRQPAIWRIVNRNDVIRAGCACDRCRQLDRIHALRHITAWPAHDRAVKGCCPSNEEAQRMARPISIHLELPPGMRNPTRIVSRDAYYTSVPNQPMVINLNLERRRIKREAGGLNSSHGLSNDQVACLARKEQ